MTKSKGKHTESAHDPIDEIERLTASRDEYAAGYAQQREQVDKLTRALTESEANASKLAKENEELKSHATGDAKLRELLDWTIKELDLCHTSSYANHIKTTLQEALAGK